ncbi:MAG: SRPBCC family protein [Vulcanimicrobiaceae bacterium]
MAIVTEAHAHPGLRSFSASLDIETPAEEAFALLCAVEKWPVWLSFLRSAKLCDPNTGLALGSEVVVRAHVPGEEEQLYEVDQFIANYHLSLVGAYSVRRRLDFRIERKTSRSKLHVKLAYPAYGGRVGVLVDRWKHGRRLAHALDEALVHFKGLVEYRSEDGLLGDL